MPEEREIVRFGLFTADLRTAELKKGQDTVPLQKLPFRLLAVLLGEPGRVFTRDELRQELWPADTFVDFERGISTAVNKIREALGDSAANPRFVETVGRSGYRFIAPVTALPQPAVAGLSAAPAPISRAAASAPAHPAKELSATPARISLRKRTAFFSLAVTLIALAVLAFDHTAISPAPRVIKTTPLTTSGRVEPAAGLQTDGSRLFFVERSGARWSLMQTSIAGGDVVPVQVPLPSPILFALSPDRTQMLLATRGEYSQRVPLWIMPIQGGAPQRVGDVTVDSAAWFPDGQRLLCSAGNEVFSVERDGTHRRHLFDVDGVAFRFGWRPNGSSFRFSVAQKKGNSLWEAAADGSNLHPLLPGWNDAPNDCCGSWSPDGRNYVFRSDQSGQEDLWLLHESFGWPWESKSKLLRLTNGPTSFSEPVISPDGRKIFATGLEARAYVSRFDPQTHEFSRTPLPDGAFDLSFSHDGKWVAYIGPPSLTLWRSRVDGTEKLQLTAPALYALTPRWSPDDKQILFAGHTRKDEPQTYIVSAEGGAHRPVFQNPRISSAYPDWFGSQQQVIAGAQLDTAPQVGITLADLATNRVSELPSSKGLTELRASPRGDYVAAASADLKQVWLFNVHAQQWKQMATANMVWKFEWERDGSYVFYQDIRDPAQTIFRLDPATGKSQAIADCSRFLAEGALRCNFEGRAPDGSLMFSVMASWANLYAFDIELP
jgi:Tol biopolymer transport system component/DNA-binding winged helix-turn-helix (wHTH) protein